MRSIVVLFVMFFGFSSITFCQDVKVIGGSEKNIKVKMGSYAPFEFTLKNESNYRIDIQNIRSSDDEIYLYPWDQNPSIEPGEKETFKGTVTPKHKGKQRFQIYVDYADKYNTGKAYVVVAINP